MSRFWHLVGNCNYTSDMWSIMSDIQNVVYPVFLKWWLTSFTYNLGAKCGTALGSWSKGCKFDPVWLQLLAERGRALSLNLPKLYGLKLLSLDG